MFPRIVYESFRHQARRKLLAGIAITLGVAVATAMIAVATDIGDKINRELRSDGAKKEVTLVGTYFNKPLHFGKQDFTTGVRITHPWWKVSCGDGRLARPRRVEDSPPACGWPNDDSQNILVGDRLAAKLGKKPGDTLDVAGRQLTIFGILSTGAVEDDQIVAPLALAQQMIGKPGAVRRVYVSALTKPPDALAVRDPKSMSPEVYDRWYCSPYVESIAYQLQEVIPHSHAEQIRQVAQNEGTVLSRIKGLMLLVTLAALFASALAVSAAMATAIYERRVEIGLMKALGAGDLVVSAIFFAEALLL